MHLIVYVCICAFGIQESRPDRQEATSAVPADRGKFSNEARTALGSQIEDADEQTMDRVSQLVQAHMVNGEDGDPELDMQVRLHRLSDRGTLWIVLQVCLSLSFLV